MPEPGGIRRSSTRAMSVVMMVIGVLLVIRTIAFGGGPTAIGIWLGVAFVGVGAGRLYIGFRSR